MNKKKNRKKNWKYFDWFIFRLNHYASQSSWQNINNHIVSGRKWKMMQLRRRLTRAKVNASLVCSYFFSSCSIGREMNSFCLYLTSDFSFLDHCIHQQIDFSASPNRRKIQLGKLFLADKCIERMKEASNRLRSW